VLSSDRARVVLFVSLLLYRATVEKWICCEVTAVGCGECVKEASGANRLLVAWRNLWGSRKLQSSHVLSSEMVFSLFNHDYQLQWPVSVFLVTTPYSVVGGYRCFGETYRLIFSVKWPENAVICRDICTHPLGCTVQCNLDELNRTIEGYLELMNICSSSNTSFMESGAHVCKRKSEIDCGVWFHSFVVSILDGGKSSASLPGHVTLRRKSPRCLLARMLGGHKCQCVRLEEGINFALLAAFELRFFCRPTSGLVSTG
jgi:hypothetical protein